MMRTRNHTMAGLLGAVAVVVALGACGGGEEVAQSATPTTTTPAPTSTSATPSASTSVSDLALWAALHQKTFTTISRAGAKMQKANGIEQFSAACTTLHDAVADLDAVLPAPDPTVDTELKATVQYWDEATHLCTQAVEQQDTAMLKQSLTAFLEGAKHMAAAGEAMQAAM